MIVFKSMAQMFYFQQGFGRFLNHKEGRPPKLTDKEFWFYTQGYELAKYMTRKERTRRLLRGAKAEDYYTDYDGYIRLQPLRNPINNIRRTYYG